jgi:hypothetical protein
VFVGVPVGVLVGGGGVLVGVGVAPQHQRLVVSMLGG